MKRVLQLGTIVNKFAPRVDKYYRNYSCHHDKDDDHQKMIKKKPSQPMRCYVEASSESEAKALLEQGLGLISAWAAARA
jgi:phosphomannomutase